MIGTEDGKRIPTIVHFAAPADWAEAERVGTYAPSCLREEGFVHAATEEQIPGVIARHLRGRGPRIRLTLDCQALGGLIQWEWSNASGGLYPHVFGAIPMTAIVQSSAFDPDAA